jgi:SAM-dependent methyltransferase
MSFTDRFTSRVDAYVLARPSYPLEAIDFIIAGLGDPMGLTVADLGAGTGISSRLIASCGPQVLAVEPNAKMRAAAAPDPRIRWVDGLAEATSLDDASVDAAVAFQAWHWVDHAGGATELRRIVRPGGSLGCVYNERDESDPFTVAYGEIVRRFAQDDTEQRRADALAAFASIDPARTTRASFRNGHLLDRDGVHERAKSSSYLPQSGDAATEMHAAIDALLDDFAAERYDMRLLTHVVRVDVY